MKKQPKNKTLDPSYICNSKDPTSVRELLSKVGDKWSIFILLTLEKMPQCRARFSELERGIPGISQRMLTLTLRNLERDGLVMREVFPEVPPRVEYEITALGKTLFQPLQGLVDWVTGHWEQVKKSQSRFDTRE
jgi:DNA-binding HxlR family transcriptional regulator